MKLLKLATCAALAALIALPSSAAVMSAADLTIQQLLLLNSNGQPLTAATVKLQSEMRTGNASSDFDGQSAAGSNVTSNVIGAKLDLPTRCAGPSCNTINTSYGGNASNNLATHLETPAGNFALADMYIQGSALNASGAAGLTRADVSVSQLGEGGANTTIANGAVAKTALTVTSPIKARFGIAYDVFVNAFVGALVPDGAGQASATVSYSLSLREGGTTILSFRPAQLNQGAMSNSWETNVKFASSGIVYSDFFTLRPGKTYSLTINQSSNASAAQQARDVPEPGSLFLTGLGLLGLAGVARRKRKA